MISKYIIAIKCDYNRIFLVLITFEIREAATILSWKIEKLIFKKHNFKDFLDNLLKIVYNFYFMPLKWLLYL